MHKSRFGALAAIAAMLAAPLAAQQASFDGMPSVKDIVAQAKASAAEVPVPSAKPSAAAMKDLTIMVFMNGKNSLSEYVKTDMNEMETAGSSDKVNIVVQAGRIYQAPNSYPDYPGGYDDYGGNPWGGVPGHPGLPPMMKKGAVRADENCTGVRRYYVLKDNDVSVTGSKMLQDMGKVDMGDWNQLVEFGKWAKANYPAKKYMLIVWNHGDGWVSRSARPAITRGISYDDETGHGITTIQLGQSLAGMGGVDVYASDACLMQMAEVVYELKDHAQVMIGSEETEPGDGWNYGIFLSKLKDLSDEGIAKAAVDGYIAGYSYSKTGATMAAARAGKAAQLRALLDQWADLAMTQDKAKLMEAAREAKGFGGADSRDLLDFLSIAGTKVPALKAKGGEIAAFFNGSMLIKNATSGDSYKKAAGMGVYLPLYDFDANYSKMAMSKDGKWDEFTQWLLAK